MPDFQLTPQRIFQNEILAFDVNFFNPKADKVTIEAPQATETISEGDYNIGYEVWAYDKDGNQKDYTFNSVMVNDANNVIEVSQAGNTNTFSNTTPQSIAETVLSSIGKEGQQPDNSETLEIITYENGEAKYEELLRNTYQKYDDGTYGGGFYLIGQNHTFRYGDCKVKVKYYIQYYNGWISKTQKLDGSVKMEDPTVSVERSPAKLLQPFISSWYTTLRNIALVALLSVLVYIGIRITLSSVASDKAKYKQMLGDWVVALCLIFIMHYIMSFAVSINEKIIDAISSITVSSSASQKENSINNSTPLISEYTSSGATDPAKVKEQLKNVGKEDETGDTSPELFLITDPDDVKLAWDTLVGEKGENSKYYSLFNNSKTILAWPANDFMTQARLYAQKIEVKDDGSEVNASQTAVARAGYNIIYIVLVIYTVIFCFIYLKRVIYMAFLTIIAPLVAITYPIDKMNDGKAQAFDIWLKEYIFNLLIQPLHLILYTILIGAAMDFAVNNIFYVVIALGFLMPAEKLLRRFFGFEKAQTPGLFAGAASSALMMTGLNKLMHPKTPKGGLGSGGHNSKDGEEEETKTPPWRDKEFDATDNLIGIGGRNTQNNQHNTNTSEFRDNLTEEELQRLNFAQTGKKEAVNAMNIASTEDEKREYQALANSYENDINTYRNPDFVRMNNLNNFNNRNNISDRIRNSSLETPKRKKSIKRALSRGARNYFTGPNGLGEKMKAKHKANGGFVKRGARMAAGVAAAGTLAAAGGIIGITSGDPSKAAQYMAAGAAGGYALGKGTLNSVADSLKVQGTFAEAKKGYYGDDYKEKQQEEYKKDFLKNEKNLRKIEDKLHVERKEAKKIMEEKMGYYLDHEIYDMDDAIATYRLEKEAGMSREQAVATAQYATQVMDGIDTRYMTLKKKTEYRNTFIPKFTEQGSRNPEADVDKVFDNVDKFHKFKE